jgi:hypothetical protein
MNKSSTTEDEEDRRKNPAGFALRVPRVLCGGELSGDTE